MCKSRLPKQVVVGLCLAFVVPKAGADVVNEYRDPGDKGYISLTRLSLPESDQRSGGGLSVYGEYDMTPVATWTYRMDISNFRDHREDSVDRGHIASTGFRWRYALDKNKKHEFSVKTNVVHRDYFEVRGISFRLTPIITLNRGETFSIRALVEYDFIPVSSRSQEYREEHGSSGWSTDREMAIYPRVVLSNLLPDRPQSWRLVYEDKMASGLNRGEWGVSHEHTFALEFPAQGLSFGVSRAYQARDGQQGNFWPFSTKKGNLWTFTFKKSF